MANDTRSSRKAKYGENNNGRLRQIGKRGPINSHPNVSDTTGLRRSPREMSSKKMIPSPSSTRKSPRLEKRTPPTPAVRRKSERVEKQKMPSPLGRSGRTKNSSCVNPSSSKSLGSLSPKQKAKKEKSVKQLTFEAKEVSKNEEHDLGTSQVKIKQMDARIYRTIFKKSNKDCCDEVNRTEKSTHEGGDNGGGNIDECIKRSHLDCKEVSENAMFPSDDAKAKEMRADSILSGPMEELLENNLTRGSLLPSNTTTYETSMASEGVRPDYCGEETLKILVSRNSILDENLVGNSSGHDRCKKLIPSKRKGTVVDMDLNVSATLADDDNCNMIADGGTSRLCGNIVGTGGSCSKRKRLDHDPAVSCYNESCNPSATELQDSGDIGASMGQKECPANLQNKNICLVCKGEGQLLFCDGKGCSGCYHLSCLEPPLMDAPIGVWHCNFCVRKKIQLGVYSVSEGIKSVCDAKEVPFSNVDGHAAQKEFLVKYKGLAHAHNRWVPENRLLIEAPSLLMNFNQKDQTLRFKPEWSLPHRLLQKRALICANQHDDHRINHAVDNFDCCYEWLVKWRGLGYEHATWELDNASFLHSPEGQSLIRGYENRFQRAKRDSPCSKLDKKPDWESSVNKLSQMPGGASSGIGNNNLDAVNKLREHWHKGQNAIVIDDQDRILNVVAFILSLHSDTYRPFLIISTTAALRLWEDEFYLLDPSIDVVIYSGNKEVRNSIRRLEFFDKGGFILFQVLIVVPEILIEDLDVLGGIEWEAIIVDECQCPKISSYFKQIKMLNTHLRVLLFCGQLKDSIVENLNILALLDCQSDNEKDDGLISNSTDSIVQLNERLSSHIAYRCKPESSRFVEYWVPVQISPVQLEQYCATLLSNTSILRSSSKSDLVGALRDVLISTRKCCNHPYVVDPSLKSSLTKGLQEAEYLDVEIKASGKLQLLDSLLMELRKKGLRGLVLFQSIGGSGRDSIGDILDDFLRLRFGPDSYERVDKGLLPSKKQAALKIFNSKDSGRFVFLLETCACLPSIKLSSVDTIIIFDSDWNPMNDIRSLQRITLDSQFEQIKIFRLYSLFTVEEASLLLAKYNKTIDSNLQNISRSTSHMLLMWGASCLFDDLRVFHDGETSESSLKSLSGQPIFKEAVREFSSILSHNGEDNDTSNCSILLKVQPNGVTYRADFSLLGELKLRVPDEEPSHIFWSKLLEGKRFRWKYTGSSSQRSRKRVHHFDGSVHRPDLVSEDIPKKRKKVSNDVVDQPSSKSEGENLCTENKAGNSGDLVDRPHGNDVESEERRKMLDEQSSLHLLLKPEIAKLCEILLLPDKVKSMADNFLQYVMKNHPVKREPVSILQAFEISLCWTAASLLKHKLDHKASLLLAKQYLNFDCKKKEVYYIYSTLRCLKKIFLYHTGNYSVTGSPRAYESSNRVYSCKGDAIEVELANKDLSKSIKDIQKKCRKQLGKLLLMQEEEKRKLKAALEDERAYFERRYKIESAVIRSCSLNDVLRTEKLKVFNSKYDARNEEMKWQHETRLKDLEAKQLAERLRFQDWEASWVEEVKSWAQNELFPLKELRTGVEYLQFCDQAQPHNCPKNVVHVSAHVTEGKSDDNMVKVKATRRAGTGIGLSATPETNSPVVVLCSSPVELQTPLVKHTGGNEMDIMYSEDQPVSGNEGHSIAENQYGSHKNNISHFHSRERNSEAATSMTDEGEGSENISRESRDGCGEDTIALVLPASNGEMCDGKTSDAPSGEVALGMYKTTSTNDGQDEVCSSTQEKLDGTMLRSSGCGVSLEVKANGFSDGMNNIASLNSQSPEEHIPSLISMHMPNCENAPQFYEADDSTVSNNAVTVSSPLSDERIADGAILSVLDRGVPVGTLGTSNVTAMNPRLSMEQISDGCALNVSNLDKELSRPCGTASPYKGLDTVTLLYSPSEHQNPDGVSSSIPDGQIPVKVPEASRERATVTVLDGGLPVGTPGVVNFTDYPENITPQNPPSSMDQVSGGGSASVSVLGSVLSSRPCGVSCPNNGPVTISLLNPPLEQQLPGGDSLSMHDGEIPVIVPENSQVSDCHNDGEHLMNCGSVDKGTTSDQQEGLPRTMTEYTLSQETPGSRPADVMEPLEQVQQLSSVEAPPDKGTAGEMQNSSQLVELVCSPVDIVPANQCNHVSPNMDPSDLVLQLPSSGFHSSNQDPSNLPLVTEVEHQPINEDVFPSHDLEASITVSNQAVVQPDSNAELDSHSHQVVVHPASNSDLYSLMPSGVRTQSSDTRNLSIPSEINNHPIQTANQSAPRMLPPLCSDSLKNELERIQKVIEQIMKNHEDVKLELKFDFEKEFEELRRKYDNKFQEIEVEFQQTKKNLNTSLNIVHANKTLAEAFRSKCMDHKISGAIGMRQDPSFMQQLFQLRRQQGATWPSLVAVPSSWGPPAASLQCTSTPDSCYNMVPPIQAAYNTSGIFSSVSTRPPHINSISSPSGNLQAGSEIRPPASHLQPYRPSTSVPASSLPALPHGMPSQPAPSSIPATSSFSQRYQFDPHMGPWPESAGGLPTPNSAPMDLRMNANSQSGINLPNVLSCSSDVASLSQSRFGTNSSVLANSTHQATTPDVVCLSDDD